MNDKEFHESALKAMIEDNGRVYQENTTLAELRLTYANDLAYLRFYVALDKTVECVGLVERATANRNKLIETLTEYAQAASNRVREYEGYLVHVPFPGRNAFKHNYTQARMRDNMVHEWLNDAKGMVEKFETEFAEYL